MPDVKAEAAKSTIMKDCFRLLLESFSFATLTGRRANGNARSINLLRRFDPTIL